MITNGKIGDTELECYLPFTNLKFVVLIQMFVGKQLHSKVVLFSIYS